MSRQARIEEVSDSETSDPMEMDPSDFEPTRYSNPAQVSSPSSSVPSRGIPSTLINPAAIPSSSQQTQYASAAELAKFKGFQCIYPVYFDKTRSRVEGRRVSKQLAVENPLARDIVDAVQTLGLKTLFEPGKQHPKDWANPGRVKVLVKQDGRPVNPRLVKNKHHLYTLIATYLKAHPTTEASAQRLRLANMPPMDPNKPIPPPAIPRGRKMGTILPLHSPALSGGGVSENILRDMMADMQGLDPGSGNASEIGGGGADGGSRKKKEKKKGKA